LQTALSKDACFALQEKGMMPTFWLIGKDPSLTTETEWKTHWCCGQCSRPCGSNKQCSVFVIVVVALNSIL